MSRDYSNLFMLYVMDEASFRCTDTNVFEGKKQKERFTVVGSRYHQIRILHVDVLQGMARMCTKVCAARAARLFFNQSYR